MTPLELATFSAINQTEKNIKNYSEVNTPKQAKQNSKQLLMKPKIIS